MTWQNINLPLQHAAVYDWVLAIDGREGMPIYRTQHYGASVSLSQTSALCANLGDRVGAGRRAVRVVRAPWTARWVADEIQRQAGK